MATVEKQAVAWRVQYDTELNDLNQQRSQVRTYVGALRNEAELQEGRRRLRIATEFKARKRLKAKRQPDYPSSSPITRNKRITDSRISGPI